MSLGAVELFAFFFRNKTVLLNSLRNNNLNLRTRTVATQQSTGGGQGFIKCTRKTSC